MKQTQAFGQSTMQKQKQMMQTAEMARSFRATTQLAQGLTRERATIQHELQKISQVKSSLEELKNTKKVKEPLLTAEEKQSKLNKATIKGTGFNMEMVCSLPGKQMIEAQRDSRRQRHLEALKECEKFVEQFFDSFSEKKSDIKSRIQAILAQSDVEISQIMEGLSDQLLLENEIVYVNGIWEKVNQHRQHRKEAVAMLRLNLDDLKKFQEKGSGGYLESMRRNLTDIAFFLEPQVEELIASWVTEEKDKYAEEHKESEVFFQQVVDAETLKFEGLYAEWKEAVVRFHIIKQDDAIDRFLKLMNSEKFVNPRSRVEIFEALKQNQKYIFNQRLDLVKKLELTPIAQLNKEVVSQTDENLRLINDSTQTLLDEFVDRLTKDMDNTNEDIDIALFDLKDFMLKNEAQLEEGQTYDTVLEMRATPTVNRRKLESKTLLTGVVKFILEMDVKMNVTCQNIVNFFKDLATKLDGNRDKLKQAEVQFQVALVNSTETNEENIIELEKELKQRIEEMKRAIHHNMLNEKLQECFDNLDRITKQFREYNSEYISLVKEHPTTMDAFYRNFELECVSAFHLFGEGRREQIQSLFEQETAAKQQKLEEEALKKLEEEKKAEEAKKAEEDKNKPAPAKGKQPPPAKKGKEPEKPLVDVPKIPVPEIQQFESQMGNTYLVERSLEEIAVKLTKPQVDEENQQEPPKEEAPPPVQQPEKADLGKESKLSQNEKGKDKSPAGKKPPQGKDPKQQQQQQKEQVVQQQLVVETEPEEVKEEPPNYSQNFEPNDYLDKAQLIPPLDPFGNEVVHKDVVFTEVEIVSLLQVVLNKVLDYLFVEKATYGKRIAREGKDLIDKNVDELDDNLRKQWPRKGKLEVEVYQERKSQISAHNKKYERQVRTCLEKMNMLEEQWIYVSETVEQEFANYQVQQDKLKGFLPSGKNLAELQGVSRKEKDANQTFEEKCREFYDKLFDIGLTQADVLVQQNNEMLNLCQLFEKGGNYSQDEVEWYRGQMVEINDMIEKSKVERDEKLKQINDRMEKLMREPNEVFEKEYKTSIVNLSAKEGLGKTFGQPRRLAQERLRAEMTKCESAQKGVDDLLQKLRELCERQYSQEPGQFDFHSEKKSLSMEMRVTLVSVIRCIIHYGQHLSGFVKEPKTLVRISYSEKQPELDLQPNEAGAVDEKRKEEELEHLGAIGFKNVTQVQLKWNETVAQIEKQAKELCPKLYTGENAKFLVGADKIPEYLSLFLEGMKKQAEDFRISSVRILRTSALQLVEICQLVPKAVFSYLRIKYSAMTLLELNKEDRAFKELKKKDDELKEKHLKLFRPNLENPANKILTEQLNEEEVNRTTAFKESIDDFQIKMLDLEQALGIDFYNAYLNNVRGLIRIFDCLLYREDFILLPGDEIIEKKHQNIKFLTAQAQKQDISKRATRKFPGLGKNVFEVDFPSMFDNFKDFKVEQLEQPVAAPDPKQQQQQPPDPSKNELSIEVEIANTEHHKQIVRARNEHYEIFKKRFLASIKSTMERFDHEREEELRFNAYWAANLKEITMKHI